MLIVTVMGAFIRMRKRQMREWFGLLCAATALSGCVAAAVPVVIGGVAAKHMAGRNAKQRPSAKRSAGSQGSSPAIVPNSSGGALAVGIHPGTLPPPDHVGTGSQPDSVAVEAAPGPPRTAGGPAWALLGHYVASIVAEQHQHSALLARGSASSSPRWVECGNRSPAVLARLDTVVATDPAGARAADQARLWVEALQTMGVNVILTSPRAEAERPVIVKNLRSAGVSVAAGRDGLLLDATPAALPALRADLAQRFCVVAVAGRAAEDFPNSMLPETSPAPLRSMWGAGWFLVDADRPEQRSGRSTE